MHKRFLLRPALFLAAFLWAAATSTGWAQPSASTDENRPPVAASQFADIEQEGRIFEQQGRWLDALAHYDSALRDHPEAEAIRLRRTLAHIHVDLDRRMADSTFRDFNVNNSESQALSMFQEICLKVKSHYVHEPNWQRLAWRGTANLDVALTDPNYRQQFVPQATDEQIRDFRNVLRTNVNRRTVSSRTEARDLAAYTAHLANRQLGMPSTPAIAEYCAGAIASLDQYSSYLTAAQLNEVYSQIEGNFVGLGVELKANDDALLIVKVIPGGPAETAGVQAGDRILAVDGQSTADVSTEKAADLLKGEEGTTVQLVLASDAGERSLTIRRQRVDVPSVEATSIVDAKYGIGYFRLTSFQKSTSRDVDEALWELHRQGMQSLIIDVRGNPGGLLKASVEVADKFVQEGTLVSTRGRSPREDFDYKAHRVGTWQVPLVVLIDGDTASASEIFAGAIRDHGRGTILGERSYGKGSVQSILPLSIARTGIRLTTAKFYSPSGKPISDRGVDPHRTVRVVLKPETHGLLQSGTPSEQEDAVVAAACETARQLTVAHR